MSSTQTFQNRVIFLLIVIIFILIIMLWGAYNAYVRVEEQVSNKFEKIETSIEKIYNFEVPLVTNLAENIKNMVDEAVKYYKDEVKPVI